MKSNSLYITLLLFFLSLEVAAQIDSKVPVPEMNVLAGLTTAQRQQKMDSLFKSVACDTVSLPAKAFAAGFEDKYISDKDFDYHRDDVEFNVFKRWVKTFKEWIAWLLGYGTSRQVPGLFSLVFKIVAGLIILTVIYFIVRYAMNHSGRWLFQKKNEEIELDIHDTAQLIQSADFASLISEVEKQGDTRQAIRLYYLWLLKDLKDKRLIEWLPEKTNADYLYELKDEEMRSQFSYLSYLFNCIWYGEFSINHSEYQAARRSFLVYLKKEVADE